MSRGNKLGSAWYLLLAGVVFAMLLSDSVLAQYRRPGAPPPGGGGGGRRPVRPVQPGPGYGQPIPMYPPRHGDAEDAMAYNLLRNEVGSADCSGLNLLMTRVSNRIVTAAATPDGPLPPGRTPDEIRRRMMLRLRQNLRNPRFLRNMWERVTYMHQGCGQTCFNEGQAVGLISGTAYCALSVAFNGLPNNVGYLHPELPSCTSEMANGCRQGFNQAAYQVPGCYAYAHQDPWRRDFELQISQDCYFNM